MTGHCFLLYNDVNDTCGVICLYPWYIGVQILGRMSRENSFLCFVQYGAWFWKCLRVNFGLNRWTPCKKLHDKEEKWRNGDKKSSWQLEDAWSARNLHKSFCRVSSLREARCFANVFAIILPWASEDVEKRFEETSWIQAETRKKRRDRDKKKHLGLKKKSSNSQGIQCGCVYQS